VTLAQFWEAVRHAAPLALGRLDGVLAARLVITLILCGAIGLERSAHDHASGFRPHILVGLGGCLMTMAGAYGFADVTHTPSNPMAVASYVVSGIGFLGAGAILRSGTSVRGLTTAATLWGVAGVGIAVGAGLAGLATLTVALVLFTLGPLQRLEARLRYREEARDLVIRVRDEAHVGKTLAALARLGVQVRRSTIAPGVGTSAIVQVQLGQALRADQVALVTKRLLTLRYVERVETALLERDEDEPEPRAEAVVRDVDVTDVLDTGDVASAPSLTRHHGDATKWVAGQSS